MICPRCDNDVSPSQGKCPKCDAALEPHKSLAAEDLSEDHTLLVQAEADELDSDHTLIAQPNEEDSSETILDSLASGDSGTILDHSQGGDATQLDPSSGALSPEKSDTGPLELGQEFGKRYHIIKLLGLGGMGAVYQAWDIVLGIVVALKVVRPEVGADPKMAAELDQRFKRELLLAREVTHKNVVRIHDLGEIDGIKYITMSFIDGEDLSSVLKREGNLPVSVALPLIRSVLSGLLAAHEAGVVHRDLKPANIMLSSEDGEAHLMDFGVARSSNEAPSKTIEIAGLDIEKIDIPDLGQTMAGAVVGTLEYMSPEQFSGKVADQRSDLYTLGLIFYDMLSGARRAKSAKSAISEVLKRTEHSPPPIRTVVPEVPEPLAKIISRCLEPDLEDRYQTTQELADDLEMLDDDGDLKPIKHTLTWKLVTTATVVVITLLAGTFWFARNRAPEEPPEPMSILVADFQNETGDPTFEGAIEEALNIAMEGAAFVSAHSRPSALVTAEELQPGTGLDAEMAQLISRREGIDVVLAGTLSEKRSGYHVSVEAWDAALEAEDAKPLAKASASARNKDGLLEAVGRVASDLRERLGDTEPESARLAAAETFTASSLEAMNAYAGAQELMFQGQFEEALALYQQAVDLDPEFGRAYSGMGVVYANLKQFDKAKESYDKALQQLDRMTAREKYRTLGLYYLQIARNNEKAIENYETLTELFPADRAGHINLSLAYLYARDFDLAVEAGRKAVELVPSDLLPRTNYSMYLMYAGDFEESVEQAKIVLESNPKFGYALFTLARSAVGAGDFEVARQAYRDLRELGGFNGDLATLGEADLEMYLGRYGEAALILEAALVGAEESGGTAPKYLALGEAQQALGLDQEATRNIERAVELSSHESVQFPAARVLIGTGDLERAEQIALTLENKLQSQTVAYARLIQGEVALERNRLLPATEALRDGWERDDSWMAHYLSGKAYLAAGHYPEALGEFQACLDRTGEALDIFLVDGSTIRYLPPTYYYLGRAQEGLGDAEAARESYRQYLDLRAQTDFPDPLAADASQRWSSLGLAEAG